jgi:hypothetical protein
MKPGARRRTIRALPAVWSKPILTQRIKLVYKASRNARRKASETPLMSPEVAVFEKIVLLLANGIVIRSGWPCRFFRRRLLPVSPRTFVTPSQGFTRIPLRQHQGFQFIATAVEIFLSHGKYSYQLAPVIVA